MKIKHGPDYDAIDALRASHAKLLLKSPKHFKGALVEPEDPTKYAVGTCVHGKVVEGKDMRSLFAIKPRAIDYRTSVGKAWRDAQTKPILREEESDAIEKMADAIALDERARVFVENCKLREHILCEVMQDVMCKSRLDMVGIDAQNRPGFVELKTSLDVSEDFWKNRCCKAPYHYDLSMEWYCQMLALDLELEARPWSVWICVENKPPWDVAVYAPVEFMIASGLEKVQRVLTIYKKCKAENHWPGVSSNGIKQIDAPEWRVRQLAHKTDVYE